MFHMEILKNALKAQCLFDTFVYVINVYKLFNYIHMISKYYISIVWSLMTRLEITLKMADTI